MHPEPHTDLNNLNSMQHNLRTSAKGSNDAYDVLTSLTLSHTHSHTLCHTLSPPPPHTLHQTHSPTHTLTHTPRHTHRTSPTPTHTHSTHTHTTQPFRLGGVLGSQTLSSPSQNVLIDSALEWTPLFSKKKKNQQNPPHQYVLKVSLSEFCSVPPLLNMMPSSFMLVSFGTLPMFHVTVWRHIPSCSRRLSKCEREPPHRQKQSENIDNYDRKVCFFFETCKN